MKTKLPCVFGFGLIAAPLLGSAASITQIEREQGIPDYSYAGYHHSERAISTVKGPVFNIVDFGAKLNDEKSDRTATTERPDREPEPVKGEIWAP